MMNIRKSLFILNLTALLAIAALTVHAQQTPPESFDPETLLYAAQGPYAVGRSWFLVNGETDNPMMMVIWYPALTPEGDQTTAPLTIPDEYHFPDEADIEAAGDWGSTLLHATPDSSNAPYPLIIFSPGAFVPSSDYLYLQEHLASYGFIVATRIADDRGGLWSTYVGRPLRIPDEIDFAERLNTLEGSFQGLIDAQHVGIVGHSLGGFTGLVAAGAQFDLHWFETWCAENPNSAMAQLDCSSILLNQEAMMALANLDALPSGLWPSWRDDRVKAIVSQSIPAQVLGPAGLASVTIPVMIQFGSNDREVGADWGGYQTYASLSSPVKAQVVFEGGNHMMFTNQARVAPARWDINYIHDLINHYTTAFLLDTLKGDQAAHQALLPDALSFPNVTYLTTMN